MKFKPDFSLINRFKSKLNPVKWAKTGIMMASGIGIVASLTVLIRDNAWAQLRKLQNPLHAYSSAWERFTEKLDALKELNENNFRLREENTQLKLALTHEEFKCRAEQAKSVTQTRGENLSHETGSKTGRMPTSLTYVPPSNLLPNQLFALGVSYFKAHEMEKAAAIFTHLTELEGVPAYKTAEHYLATGVAWYFLDNYTLADQYLNEAFKKAEPTEGGTETKTLAQARLWKALVAERQKKHVKAQYWLKDLIDHHPHAPESAWVNFEVGRPPEMDAQQEGSTQNEEPTHVESHPQENHHEKHHEEH